MRERWSVFRRNIVAQARMKFVAFWQMLQDLFPLALACHVTNKSLSKNKGHKTSLSFGIQAVHFNPGSFSVPPYYGNRCITKPHRNCVKLKWIFCYLFCIISISMHSQEYIFFGRGTTSLSHCPLVVARWRTVGIPDDKWLFRTKHGYSSLYWRTVSQRKAISIS